MSVFSEASLSILTQYRSLLRKMTTNRQQREAKLIELQLDYQYSKDSDYQLYQKLSNVLIDLKGYCQDNNNSSYYYYSGVKRFYSHLENFLKQYHIDNKSIVHCTQLASKYMIEVIQLAAASSDTLCGQDTIKRLAAANQHIATYGVAEQHKQHLENLEKYRDENPAFFDGMINNFHKAISDASKEPQTAEE